MNELQALIQLLSAVELTVREQARTPENDPTLTWPIHFPSADVDSVDLASIEVLDVRVIGDRREWNADGRYIPAEVPPAREFSMVPLEQYFTIAEYEMQKLGERFNGNRQLIIDAARASIPRRVESLTTANVFAVEYESIRAWIENKIVVRNPQTNQTYEASMQIDANRYVTDATAWSATNAYDRLIYLAEQAVDSIGSVGGVRLRRNLASLIQQSAPRLTTSEVRMTMRDVQDRISDELGTEFTIIVDERAVDKFDGAGNAKTKTKLFPELKLGFFPTGFQIGDTNRAPQFRAQDLPQVVSNFEGFDPRGQRIFYSPKNNGKSLKVEAQWNVLSIPREQNVFVGTVTLAP